MIEQIKQLFISYFAEQPQHIAPLPQSGSSRQYFRVQNDRYTAIAAYHTHEKENKAFIGMTQHFGKLQLAVPTIYTVDLENNIYLQQDLGDQTLLQHIRQWQIPSNSLTNEAIIPADKNQEEQIKQCYQTVIKELIHLQIKGHQQLDYETLCIERNQFDKQAILWDMQYFKYCFLKIAQIQYGEQQLEDEFNLLANFLTQDNQYFFSLRDCQARNIMWQNNQPYFIDYQGGMKGALQYDLASLLFQAQAQLTPAMRTELLEYYIEHLQTMIPTQPQKFKQLFYGYALARTLQVLGAYGLRGLHQQKEHFLQSIPQAIKNLQWLLKSNHLPLKLPQLNAIEQQMQQLTWANKTKVINHLPKEKTLDAVTTDNTKISVTINSFSYRKTIPTDTTGHGIGYVFDCRSIHNPGRYDAYKHLTGKDQPVILFLEKQTDVADYLLHVYALIDKTIQDYLKRGMQQITVNFGCTGGQHRSVYCAEMTAQYLKHRYQIISTPNHTNKENWLK